ncbi:hypothetical protein BOX15_Mlig022396g1 [Macrostomum lignano]|uniref:RING-CH-type domain-containing protein n=1 Tax=Macrostomum lignano TaxID=282301 RepID=A0A267GG65_9PLAT|nr:hypothetical protein BOX15_Mlig022396g1 [Macrostomum lignano]
MAADSDQTETHTSAIGNASEVALHTDDPLTTISSEQSPSVCLTMDQLSGNASNAYNPATSIDGDRACPDSAAATSARAIESTLLAPNAEVDDEKPDETPVCRICLDGASSGPLRRLCACQGTVGSLHRHCLTRWLGLSKKQHCELCLQPLPVVIDQPGLVQYIRNAPKRCHCVALLDLVSLLLMLPLIVYCNLLSVSALQHFRELRYLRLRQYSFWEICFGIVLTPFLLSGFLLWIWFVCRGHRSEYRRWRLEHRRVTLCESESSLAEQ